ncbi:MAG: ribonuclease III domain-containing protein [Candidatus Odinarchaeota archaeon]
MKLKKSREEQLADWISSNLDIEIATDLLDEALTHPSYRTLEGKMPDNQRLEVIGDAVLDLLVINWFYDRLEGNEGILTQARARVVNNNTLATIGRQLIPVSGLLRTAPSYEIHDKDVAAAVESLFGACFKSSGLETCQKLLNRLLLVQLETVLEEEKEMFRSNIAVMKSPVNILQEYFQRQHLLVPSSKIEIIGGPDHARVFRAIYTTILEGKVITGTGTGKTKKKAREEAAKDLCHHLGLKVS